MTVKKKALCWVVVTMLPPVLAFVQSPSCDSQDGEAPDDAPSNALLQRVLRHGSELTAEVETEGLRAEVVNLTKIAMGLATASMQRGSSPEHIATQHEAFMALLRVINGNSTSGMSHLNGVDKTALEEIVTLIKETMFGNLDSLHEEDQALIVSSHAALAQCNIARQSTASGVVAFVKAAVEAARARHLAARREEAALAANNISANATYSETIMDLPNPPSECPEFTRTREGMEWFFDPSKNEYLQWFQHYQPGVLKRKEEAEGADSALSSKRKEANALQGDFEKSFCEYQDKQIEMCKIYHDCFAAALANYQEAKASVRANEKSRKMLLKSGHAIVCHLQVILEPENKTHSHCDDTLTGVNVSGYDVHYPEEPAADSCTVTAATASSPCDEGFVNLEYGELPELVVAAPCTQCPWETAAPTPVPPVPTAAPTQATPGPSPAPVLSNTKQTVRTNNDMMVMRRKGSMKAPAAPAPAPESDIHWFKGGAGMTCDDTCTAWGMTCDSDMQSTLTSVEKVKAAFLKAGYVCKSFHTARGYAGTPFSTGRNRDDCAPLRAGSRSVCDENRNNHHAPLCSCKP